jgi:1-deoxy-D-xylulose-5-phosphate synthase
VLDRAGIVGADGATHQGLYDLAYLRTVPNMVIMAPKDENELRHMLCTAIEHPGPAALRIPRGSAWDEPVESEIKPLKVGEAELLRDGSDVALIAVGLRVVPTLQAADLLAADGIRAAVLNARFVKPIDRERVCAIARRCGAVVTVEEHAALGGFGEAVLSVLAQEGVRVPVRTLAVRDEVIEHGSPDEIIADLGLDAAGIARAARDLLRETSPDR